jgi:uncharacterized membrane protein YhdT
MSSASRSQSVSTWGRAHLLWAFLVPLLGLNLWAVLALVPLQLEWVDPTPRLWALGLYLAPLVVLSVGVVLRWSPLPLAVFPASLIPVFLTLPEADQGVFSSGGGFFSLATSLVLYLLASARWLGLSRRDEALGRWWRSLRGPASRPEAPTPPGHALRAEPGEPPPLRRDLWWPYRLYFVPRAALMALSLAVWVYGLNFSQDIALRYLESFGEDADQARVLLNLLFLFVWVVAMYLFFFTPGLNLELEQRDRDAQLQRMRSALGERRSGWRVALWTVTGGLALLALLWWRGW